MQGVYTHSTNTSSWGNLTLNNSVLNSCSSSELTNHLGNVLSTISDRKIWNSTDSHYEAVVTSWADYYAFGMMQPNRHGGELGRYLFNGMEHDGEVSGNGNSYTTEFRQYDPRLGRWKSLDPLMGIQPHFSPYQAFNNNPIYFIDPTGLIGGPANGEPITHTVSSEKGWTKENEAKLPTQDIELNQKIIIKVLPGKDGYKRGDAVSYTYTYKGNGKYKKDYRGAGGVKLSENINVSNSNSSSDFADYLESNQGGNSVTHLNSGGKAGKVDENYGKLQVQKEANQNVVEQTSPIDPVGSSNTNNTEPSTLNDAADAASKATTVVDIVAQAKSYQQTGTSLKEVQKIAGSDRFVMNGKSYSNGYSGGRWHSTQSVNAAKITTKTLATVGRVVPFVSLATSTVEFLTGDMDAYSSAVYAADVSMTIVSIFCPICGTVYFVSRIFW